MDYWAQSLAALAMASTVASAPATSGQVDSGYRHVIEAPAYPSGAGPSVCIDEAHDNYHTADGLYAPFATLLRDDGFRVMHARAPASAKALAACDLYVVVNPVAPANVDVWAFPHDSAFSATELAALAGWVRNGGALLLVVDHAPIPGAVAALGALLGLEFLDVEARNDPRAPLPDRFRRSDGTLDSHPVTEGRSATERITEVATWTGTAFLVADGYDVILRYGPDSLAWIDLSESIPGSPAAEWPRYRVEGLAAAAARREGLGRVIALGEAGMCTALGDASAPRGMNAPEAAENALFCLNAVRWLAGALDADRQPPAEILGSFEDDYGIRHTITRDRWRQHTDTRYRIVDWHPDERFLTARDEAPAEDAAGPWVRIDWMPLDGMPPWEWAFCITAWNAATAADAEAATPPDRDMPRIGCGGHPFSRMRPVEPEIEPTR